jgi:hypothetical protein
MNNFPTNDRYTTDDDEGQTNATSQEQRNFTTNDVDRVADWPWDFYKEVVIL